MTELSRPNIIATCCGLYDDRSSAARRMATAPSNDIPPRSGRRGGLNWRSNLVSRIAERCDETCPDRSSVQRPTSSASSPNRLASSRPRGSCSPGGTCRHATGRRSSSATAPGRRGRTSSIMLRSCIATGSESSWWTPGGTAESAGTAMDFGWHGDDDIGAATAYLSARPDVDDRRIGAVGISMGGEEAIGASGGNPLLRAVVAEGATARTAADEAWLSDAFGWRGRIQEQLEWFQDQVTDVLTSASVPTSLRAAVASSVDTRYLLITADVVEDEGHAAAYIATGGPDRVEVWAVATGGHAGGLDAEPAEWERRVVDFLDRALATPS